MAEEAGFASPKKVRFSWPSRLLRFLWQSWLNRKSKPAISAPPNAFESNLKIKSIVYKMCGSRIFFWSYAKRMRSSGAEILPGKLFDRSGMRKPFFENYASKIISWIISIQVNLQIFSFPSDDSRNGWKQIIITHFMTTLKKISQQLIDSRKFSRSCESVLWSWIIWWIS